MKNWATKRKLTFWVHLFYVLVPALIALVAAVRLWTAIFGEWYFAVPLIVSLEGVAAIGFTFHLTGVDSPFVKARHFIPYFSVATLGYELGAFLVGKHGWELGIPVTVFVTGVFGFLFIKSFGVLEKLMIDPAEAAAEKAREQTQAILVPVHEHNARLKVFREATKLLQDAEGFVQAPSLPDGLNTHLLVAQLVEAELARREGEQSLPFGGIEVPQAFQRAYECSPDMVTSDGYCMVCGQMTDHSELNVPEYTEAELACRGCFGPCGQCEEPTQAITEARDEDAEQPDWDGSVEVTEADALAAMAERGIERLMPDELLALPDSPEKDAEFKRRIGNSVDRGLNWLVDKGFIERKADVTAEATQPAAGMPETAEPIEGMGISAEARSEPSAAVVTTWTCTGCGAEGSNGSKGVAKKWSAARSLGDALYCTACRKERS